MGGWTPDKGPRGLWRSEKYIAWPYSHAHPIVRVPRPDGSYTSHTVTRCRTEQVTFDTCLAIRDALGVSIWGEQQWANILAVKARSVAKHRQNRPGPMTGVSLSERSGRSPCWMAYWYERRPDGSRKKRSKSFSFGTEKTRYATSEQAMHEAIRLRQAMEKKWYSVLGDKDKRRANR